MGIAGIAAGCGLGAGSLVRAGGCLDPVPLTIPLASGGAAGNHVLWHQRALLPTEGRMSQFVAGNVSQKELQRIPCEVGSGPAALRRLQGISTLKFAFDQDDKGGRHVGLPVPEVQRFWR